MNLPEQIRTAIEREELIPPGASVLVGVSGGADSVALLHSLCRIGCQPVAAHLNHAIRGAEADADEQFVKELCVRLDVRCVTARTDVPALAKATDLSLEMAARQARHDFFRSVTSGLRPLTSVLCLAHHADDQLETFFLRAARGTGPAGLGGMRVRQKLDGLTLIRPMLGIRRTEIIQWLNTEGISWREDATNTDETIPRNRVRRQILPVLERINGHAAGNILRTMQLLRDEEDHPERAARRREIRDWLIAQNVSPDFETVEKVIEFSRKTDGTHFLDLEGLRLVNEYGKLGTDAPPPSRFSIRMEKGTGILRGPWCASVSLQKVAQREVTVRTPRPGDRMEPYGMTGRRKLQDIFTDLKIPLLQRAGWPVVECGGEIIWIPGFRIARGWELPAATGPAFHLFCETAAN